MSLSSGPAGGKGVDSNAVDAYDSGDEWDIGVGNLIIDLDADLEKDKLEMSGSKEGGPVTGPPVAALPDNIKFVSPVGGGQGKDGKSKTKRAKNSKDGAKTAAPPPDVVKKELLARAPGDPVAPHNLTSGLTKGGDKSGKASRLLPSVKKDKDGMLAKTKKDKMEVDKDTALPGAPLPRSGPFEGPQNSEAPAADLLGHVGQLALDSAGMGQPVSMTTEEEEEDDEEMDSADCRNLKKMLCGDKMESPSSTPAAPSLHLLANSDISSPCEQIMVRTRSLAVNTADAAQATEPECLGPCEPGTSVNLEGIVWQETEDGMLVVNVTWRNKTYVGTLLDCTRHDWAPPRFCDSPTSDVEMRGGRGRGKRMRPAGAVPANDNSTSSDNKGSGKTRGGGAGANGKGRRGSQTGSAGAAGGGGAEDAKASPSSAKRKSKPASDMEPTSSSEDTKVSKRMRSNSTGAAHSLPAGKSEAPPSLDRACPSPVLIDCPHPNCNKKYKHVNGLKYHQARAHHEHDADKYHPPRPHEHDADSEYGDESGLHPDAASCNGAAISPARSATPKGRGFDAPSPGKQPHKPGKKKTGEGEPDGTDAECLTDEASNDGVDDRKARKTAAGGKTDKMTPKGVKPGRPVPPAGPSLPASYNSPAASPSLGSAAQAHPKNGQSKAALLADPASSPLAKEKKKKDKKRREGDSPKGARPEEAYAEAADVLLNGSSEAQQSRLASIKAAADKVYSFSDNAPSPSLGGGGGGGGGGRADGAAGQNGTDGVSLQTGSPAYSDISDEGEDGEGKAEGVKVKTEPEPKKALFPPQAPPAKEAAAYYPAYDAYYPAAYANASPASTASPAPKKEEEAEVAEEVKVKAEPQDDRKAEAAAPQPSVIQQRANVYAPPPLYYNQYYGQPYSYSPDQAYHAHLLASSPAYRQQCEERQRLADKKAEGKASAGPPTLTPAPALAELAKAKPKEAAGPEQAKSVIMVKGEDPKVVVVAAAAAPPEGLKMKLSEAGHHAKDEAAMWYRQEPDARLWPYVYPNKYSDAPKAQEDERDRKLKEERSRPKEGSHKDEAKEGPDVRGPGPPEEQQQQLRAAAKEARPTHVQFAAPLAQHQGYMPYMHGPYAYGQAYEPGHPGHPGYRGVPSVMMQNYPGSYLPAGYSFSPYAGKAAAEEGGEKASRSSPTVKAAGGEAKALELLQQHASHYKSKSPTALPDKSALHERDGERPRSSPAQRAPPPPPPSHHHHHHHLAYPLLAGQYDLAYASGLSSSAMVASQQASAPSMYPPPRR